MAKINWKALQIEYIRANAKTGVSVKDWCAKKGLNLSTAKRYIKKPETVFEQAEKCEQNCETANIEKQDKSRNYIENCETNCESNCETAKQQGISQINSQKAWKHGGYARYFRDKSAFDVVVDFQLKDEIDLMRQRAVSAIESIEKYTALLEEAETAEDKEIYSKLIDSADKALERAITRVETLNYTDNSILNIKSQIEHRKAQTRKTLAEADKLEQEIKTKSRGLKDSVVYNIEF
ncbi:TPA: terminase [Pasteurella multocida]|uniref:terminase n=1 Tax=Pasteurella multocida TaxID=747 RepID=UPI00201FBE23|nr:terminase [Pasteurella multocida]MCL7818968.1 terminase [Pasteurella multocida]HDR0611621.1 terminase [Pasteurella multocida]HDR1204952.1 terminase [Pasteurella multocida]HDR1218009.1 terminase [Pasteurella multocida]HDR1816755.1 terminase [Pasteurella multocida]